MFYICHLLWLPPNNYEMHNDGQSMNMGQLHGLHHTKTSILLRYPNNHKIAQLHQQLTLGMRVIPPPMGINKVRFSFKKNVDPNLKEQWVDSGRVSINYGTSFRQGKVRKNGTYQKSFPSYKQYNISSKAHLDTLYTTWPLQNDLTLHISLTIFYGTINHMSMILLQSFGIT